MSDSDSTQALLNLASPQPAEASLHRLEEKAGDPEEWEKFLALAQKAQLLPLAAWRLKDRARISPRNRARLSDLFHRNNLRNLILVRELTRVARELEAREVRMLAIKGPVLASLCYKNLGLRRFDDLDLLIHPRDVPGVVQILRENGYRHWLPEWEEDQLKRFFSRPDYLRFLWWDQAMMTRRDPRVTTEIHWAALPRYFSLELPFDQLWLRRQAVSLSGYEVQTLSPLDTVLQITAHGAKHLWSSPKWVCDLAWALSSSPNLDWSELEARARRRGGLRIVRVGALLANRLFATAVEPAWDRQIRSDRAAGRLAGQIGQTMLESISRGVDSPEPLGQRLRLRERPLDRIRYLQRSLLTPSARDCRSLPLPPLLFPLYRLLRPLRLAGNALFRSADE